MSDEELSEKVLKQIEYEQLCEDWRHRDSMLWQSLAVAITLTGGVFGLVFGDAAKVSWILGFFLFSIASILNWVLLLKISKDHYYQLGSSELLSELGGNRLVNPSKLPMSVERQNEYDWRIHKPLKLNEKIKNGKIPFPPIYEFITNRSAFKWFFGIQLSLLILTLSLAFISILLYFGLPLLLSLLILFIIYVYIGLCYDLLWKEDNNI